MFSRRASTNLKLNIAKARETRMVEQATSVRRTRRAGSHIIYVRPGTVALFSPLLRNRR